jgi:hypothetical protein
MLQNSVSKLVDRFRPRFEITAYDSGLVLTTS